MKTLDDTRNNKGYALRNMLIVELHDSTREGIHAVEQLIVKFGFTQENIDAAVERGDVYISDNIVKPSWHVYINGKKRNTYPAVVHDDVIIWLGALFGGYGLNNLINSNCLIYNDHEHEIHIYTGEPKPDIFLTSTEEAVLLSIESQMYAKRGYSDVDINDVVRDLGLPIELVKRVIGSLIKKEMISISDEFINQETGDPIYYLSSKCEGIHTEWLKEGAEWPYHIVVNAEDNDRTNKINERIDVEYLGMRIINTGNGDGFVITNKSKEWGFEDLWKAHLGNYGTLIQAKESVLYYFMLMRPGSFSKCLHHRALYGSTVYREFNILEEVLNHEGISLPSEIAPSDDINNTIMFNGKVFGIK